MNVWILETTTYVEKPNWQDLHYIKTTTNVFLKISHDTHWVLKEKNLMMYAFQKYMKNCWKL
jgi:hypothetical protein